MTEGSKSQIEAMLEDEWEYGFKRGYQKRLVDMICIKLRKGKDVSEICEDLEENPEKIKEICKIAAEYAPEYDEEKVYNEAWNV